MAPRKVTDEQVQEIIEIYKTGEPIDAIAARFNMSSIGVRYHLKKHGVFVAHSSRRKEGSGRGVKCGQETDGATASE